MFDDSSCEDDNDSGCENEVMGFSDTPPENEESVIPTVGQYAVLSTDEITAFMKKCLQESNSVIQLPSLTLLRFLLNTFKWDQERLLESYYDKTPAQLSHLTNVDIELNLQSKLNRKAGVVCRKRKAETTTEECGICTLDRNTEELFGLRCDHCFCTTCWKDYFRVQIMVEGNAGGVLRCPAHNCEILVDDEVVLHLIEAEPKVKGRFQYLITNNFVQCNRLLTWCPKPGCENAIKVREVDSSPKPVNCSCGFQFCFQCKDEIHDPIRCELLAKWKLKIRDGSESSTWLNVNTKPCPKCSTPIEKNGGCNHMVCRSKSCQSHQFCWICLKDWSTHKDNFFCNTFQTTTKDDEDKQSRAQASLTRYLHFFNHYTVHVNSLNLEKRLMTTIEAKTQEYMEQLHLTWIEAQFLRKSVDCLRNCRQILLYTYIFAYYIERNNQQEIFEGNQADLQRAVEALSGYLETNLELCSVSFTQIKPIILNKTNYCASRCKVLVDHIEEGHEKDWWKFASDSPTRK